MRPEAAPSEGDTRDCGGSLGTETFVPWLCCGYEASMERMVGTRPCRYVSKNISVIPRSGDGNKPEGSLWYQ